MITRRTVASGLGGALLSAGFGTTISFAQDNGKPVRITHAVTSLAFIQSYVAMQNGYFSQAGLAAQIIDTGGGGPDVQLVFGGRAEMTVNDGVQILTALQEGQELVCVVSLLNRSIVNATISKSAAQKIGLTDKTSFEQKIKSLKGMKIGVTRPGSFTWQLARYNLVSAGLDPNKDAQVIAIGGPPALAAALENGAVDVIYISMPIGEKLIQDGKALSFVNNSSGEDPKLSNFMMEGLWTTPEYINANRTTIAGAVSAYKKASDFIRNSSAETVVSALKPALGSLGDAVLLDSVRRIQPAVSETGKLSASEVATTQNVLRDNGLLKRSFSLEELFDGSLLGKSD